MHNYVLSLLVPPFTSHLPSVCKYIALFTDVWWKKEGQQLDKGVLKKAIEYEGGGFC